MFMDIMIAPIKVHSYKLKIVFHSANHDYF